jgi:bifunctional ADP-heptose synthase (sugar kinase/adenylyltransferase)
VEKKIIGAIHTLAGDVDAFIIMDQVDVAETGVITAAVRDAIGEVARMHPTLPILADSRRSLRDWPPVTMKMNGNELGLLMKRDLSDLSVVPDAAAALAVQTGRPVFITLAENGMVGATPESATHRAPALPIRGEIDVVGAGDSVSANLTAALAAGAEVPEALELANAAASVVIHQLGTTGVATVGDLEGLLEF